MAAQRKQGNRLKERLTATAQLVSGDDDDLIRWLGNQHGVSKNQLIKNTLRAGLGLKPVSAKIIELDSVRQELDTLKVAVSQFPKLVQSSGGNAEIQALRTELEQQFKHINEWLEYLNTRVEQVTASPIVPPQTNESAYLTESDQQQRAAKLKKNKW